MVPVGFLKETSDCTTQAGNAVRHRMGDNVLSLVGMKATPPEPMPEESVVPKTEGVSGTNSAMRVGRDAR